MAIGFGPGRTYPVIAGRQQGADRLVYSVDDFRRVIAEAARTGDAATIRLGSDIFLQHAIVLPATTFDLIIEGGGQYAFRCASGFAATEMFVVGPGADGLLSGITFRGLTFEAPATKLARLVAGRGTTFSVSWVDCTLERIERILQPLGGSMTWRDSTFENLRFVGLTISDVTNIGTADYDRCLFFRCYGMGFVGSPTTVRQVGVDSISGSTSLIAFDAGPLNLGGFIRLTSGLGTSQLNSLDIAGDLTVNGALVTVAKELTLNSANPTLTVGSASYFRISLGASSSGNLTLSDGLFDGQHLVLFCFALTGTLTLPNSTANNTRLNTAAGAFVFGLRDTISLIWDEATIDWIELSRSVNS